MGRAGEAVGACVRVPRVGDAVRPGGEGVGTGAVGEMGGVRVANCVAVLCCPSAESGEGVGGAECEGRCDATGEALPAAAPPPPPMLLVAEMEGCCGDAVGGVLGVIDRVGDFEGRGQRVEDGERKGELEVEGHLLA